MKPQQPELFPTDDLESSPKPKKKPKLKVNSAAVSAEWAMTKGKDALNLTEFPLGVLGNRVDPGQKTITFADEIWDKAAGKSVQRTVTITGNDHYGLPSSPDEEVLLGLLQLSSLVQFESECIRFPMSTLLSVIGWDSQGHRYERAKEALQRWMGVTMYYSNAWRHHSTGKWVDASFHFLDTVIFHKEPREEVEIQWNRIAFDSFREGYLKTLDLEFYRSLKLPVSKRMFRFLDKRFYQSPEVRIEIDQLAIQKLGLSRPTTKTGATHFGVIKQRLSPAVKELEEKHFLEEGSMDAFSNAGRQIVFRAGSPRKDPTTPQTISIPENARPVPLPAMPHLEARLTGYGIPRETAHKLVLTDSTEVETQLESLDYRLGKGEKIENIGGWLLGAIRERYALPRGFKSTSQQAEEKATADANKLAKAKAREEAMASKKKAETEAKEASIKTLAIVQGYLDGLTADERRKLEEEALANQDPDFIKMERYKKATIHNFVKSLLEKGDLLGEVIHPDGEIVKDPSRGGPHQKL